MFKILSKVIGAVLVVVGVAAPIGASYMLFTRKPQVDFYIEHVFGNNSFGKLNDDRREHALTVLDAMIESAPKVGEVDLKPNLMQSSVADDERAGK